MGISRKTRFLFIAVLLSAVASSAVLAAGFVKNGSVLQGEVVDKKGSRFASTVRITSLNELTGDFSGEVSWPSLNAVHRIDGHVRGNTLVFKETAYIRQGQAHLNCEYALVYDGQTLQGRWVEPGADAGTANYSVQH